METPCIHLPGLMSVLINSPPPWWGAAGPFHFNSPGHSWETLPFLCPQLWVQQGMQLPTPSASQHFGYSHSRHSSLLQHQPGCQRSQNPLAKRNKTNFSWEDSSSSSGCPATPLLTPTTRRRDHPKLHRGFKQSLGDWPKIPALHLLPPQMLWHSCVWGHCSPWQPPAREWGRLMAAQGSG